MVKIDFEKAELILSNTLEDKKFSCIDSSVFCNLEELTKGLRKMKEKAFNYHVNSEKNDFSAWIYDVIGDVKLANNVRDAKDAKSMARKIRTRITYIKKNMDKSS